MWRGCTLLLREVPCSAEGGGVRAAQEALALRIVVDER
jgi:hypothetical protein